MACSLKQLLIFRSYLLTVGFVASLLSHESRAQSAPDEPFTAAIVQQAKQLLTPYLPESDFHIQADVTPGEGAPKTVPYLPSPLSLSALNQLRPAQLRSLVKTIKFKIAIAKTYSEESKKDIKKILEDGLQLKANLGDTIEFQPLSLTRILPEERSLVREANQTVNKLQGDLRSFEQRLETMSRERDDLKKELTQAKSDLQKAYQDLTTAKTTPVIDKLDWKTLVQKHAGSAAVAILLATGLMLIALGFWSVGRSLKHGAAVLGQSMEALRSSPNSSPNTSTGTFTLDAGNQALGTSPQNSLASLPSGSLDAMYERIMSLHQELKELASEQNTLITLRVLTDLCGQEQSVGKGVALLELLGRSDAKTMFDKLSPICQENIIRFLRQGQYDRPKAEIMLAAGEELKTKLVVNLVQETSAKGRKVSDRMLQLAKEDLQLACVEMDVSLLPRFFKELTAKEVSQVMQGIFHKDKERFRICAEILPKIATVPSNSSDDEELTRYLDDLIRRNADDIQRPYLRFYQEVAESLEEDATEMLVAGLASDERVSAYVSNHVVTFSILTSFNDAQLRELIQDFTAAEVTALAAGLDAELRMRILNTLEGVRATVVKEDVDRLIESGQSFVDRAFKQIKAKTIAKIKNMKQSGLLDNNEQGRDKSAPFKFAA